MNALIAPDQVRQDFFAHERLVTTLYRAVKPDPVAIQFVGRVACLSAIGDALRAKLHPNPADISVIMGGINALLDQSITGVTLRERATPALDLSMINFQALAGRFAASKHKNTDLERLKAAIRAQLEHLVELNPTRADFAQKFQELIDSYNNGSRNIEQIYEDLLKLSLSLTDEEQRHVREHISEEELVIFDILTRPAPELTTEERAEVKKVARALLQKLKSLLVINWRQKIQARAKLRDAIETELDAGLPRAYTPEMFNEKCSAVFEHVYDKYPEPGAGVYSVM